MAENIGNHLRCTLNFHFRKANRFLNRKKPVCLIIDIKNMIALIGTILLFARQYAAHKHQTVLYHMDLCYHNNLSI